MCQAVGRIECTAGVMALVCPRRPPVAGIARRGTSSWRWRLPARTRSACSGATWSLCGFCPSGVGGHRQPSRVQRDSRRALRRRANGRVRGCRRCPLAHEAAWRDPRRLRAAGHRGPPRRRVRTATNQPGMSIPNTRRNHGCGEAIGGASLPDPPSSNVPEKRGRQHRLATDSAALSPGGATKLGLLLGASLARSGSAM